MKSSDVSQMEMDEESSLAFCESREGYSSTFNDDFEQTLFMLDMDIEELQFEVQSSHEEVSFFVVICQKKNEIALLMMQRKHITPLGRRN